MRTLLLLITLACAAWAEDLTGRWAGGTGGYIFVLQQTGERLTGTVEGPAGSPSVKVVDGHVQGNQVFFFVLHEDPKDPEVIANAGIPFHNTAKGTIEGGELKLAGSRENTKIREYQQTLRRVR